MLQSDARNYNCNPIRPKNRTKIYVLSQFITYHTYLPLSNKLPEKIVLSGVIRLGISCYSLVYMTRKTRYQRPGGDQVIRVPLM